MSHSYKTAEGTVFIHNPDMSGDVDIVVHLGQETATVRIPGSALVEFMRERDGGERDQAKELRYAQEEAAAAAARAKGAPARPGWLSERVKVIGTDFEGMVIALIDPAEGEAPCVKVIRTAHGRTLPSTSERFVRSSMEYLPERLTTKSSMRAQALQAVIAPEHGLELVDTRTILGTDGKVQRRSVDPVDGLFEPEPTLNPQPPPVRHGVEVDERTAPHRGATACEMCCGTGRVCELGHPRYDKPCTACDAGRDLVPPPPPDTETPR